MSKQQQALEYPPREGEESTLPQTYIVLRLAPDVNEKALIWLVDKIRAKRRDGGAELLAFREPYNPKEVRLQLFVINYSKTKFVPKDISINLPKNTKST